MPDCSRDILIVGGGPTGLGAAWRLAELSGRGLVNPSLDWLLVEAGREPGGMARSETLGDGFTWDLGGHVIYSHYAYFNAFLAKVMGPDLFFHERKSWVHVRDRFIPFPIQHNLHRLPLPDVIACVKDLVRVQSVAPSVEVGATFADWLIGNFGRALSELFFLPYAYKMWAYPAEMLSTVWTQRKSGSRYANVPLVNLERLLENVLLNRDDLGWVGAARFPYPKSGGAGALWCRAFDRLPRERRVAGERLIAVDVNQRTARFDSGRAIHYRHLLSSVPLPELLTMLPADVTVALPPSPLKHSCSHAIGVGFRGELPADLRDRYWVHVPDLDLPFFRVTVLSNYSPENVPTDEPHWSLLCEVSQSTHKPLDENRLVEEVVAGVRRCFGLPDQPVVSLWYRRLPYGYPVPCADRDAYLATVEPRLRAAGIWTRGRFGGWKYEVSNQDNGFMQGVEAVDAMLFGTEEITYFHPDLINDGTVGRVLPDLQPSRAVDGRVHAEATA